MKTIDYETFNVPADVNDPDGPTAHGWYWERCNTNTRRNEYFGPFDTEVLAIADAQGGNVPLLTPRCSDPTCKRCNPTDEQIRDCGLIADAQGGAA